MLFTYAYVCSRGFCKFLWKMWNKTVMKIDSFHTYVDEWSFARFAVHTNNGTKTGTHISGGLHIKTVYSWNFCGVWWLLLAVVPFYLDNLFCLYCLAIILSLIGLSTHSPRFFPLFFHSFALYFVHAAYTKVKLHFMQPPQKDFKQTYENRIDRQKKNFIWNLFRSHYHLFTLMPHIFVWCFSFRLCS